MIAEHLTEVSCDTPPMPTEERPERGPFCIDSESSADWYLSKLSAIDAEIALLQAQHDERMKRLHSDRQGLENLFQHQAEAFARERIAADKRGRRSIILPHGTLCLRTVPAGIKVTDTAAAIEFALAARPETVRTVQTLDTAAYRQWAETQVKETGEVLPGTEYLPDREGFSIRFGGKP